MWDGLANQKLIMGIPLLPTHELSQAAKQLPVIPTDSRLLPLGISAI